jgi:hypothetical protein
MARRSSGMEVDNGGGRWIYQRAPVWWRSSCPCTAHLHHALLLIRVAVREACRRRKNTHCCLVFTIVSFAIQALLHIDHPTFSHRNSDSREVIVRRSFSRWGQLLSDSSFYWAASITTPTATFDGGLGIMVKSGALDYCHNKWQSFSWAFYWAALQHPLHTSWLYFLGRVDGLDLT